MSICFVNQTGYENNKTNNAHTAYVSPLGTAKFHFPKLILPMAQCTGAYTPDACMHVAALFKTERKTRGSEKGRNKKRVA